MARYQNLMSEILDSIFQGYTMEGGKLTVVNEEAAKQATDSLHKLVLEKSRDLWDQLEAAEGSLAGVAEEIRFEELATDPSSVSTAVTHAAGEEADAVDAAPAEMDAAPALESAENLSDLLGADDLNFDDIFKTEVSENMDHLDRDNVDGYDENVTNAFDENMGDMSYEDEGEKDVTDGDEDYDDLMVGMDDAGMGSPDAEMGAMDDGDYEDDKENGDPEMGDMENGDPEMGDELDGAPNGDDMGFDFDLDLEAGDGEEDDMDEMGGMMHDGMGGHGAKSMRMESEDKDEDDDDKKDGDDDDDDDDDKPAFLKGKKDD